MKWNMDRGLGFQVFKVSPPSPEGRGKHHDPGTDVCVALTWLTWHTWCHTPGQIALRVVRVKLECFRVLLVTNLPPSLDSLFRPTPNRQQESGERRIWSVINLKTTKNINSYIYQTSLTTDGHNLGGKNQVEEGPNKAKVWGFNWDWPGCSPGDPMLPGLSILKGAWPGG